MSAAENEPIGATTVAPIVGATPSAESGLKGRVFSGASWSFLDNASQQVLSLLIFVVLGRLLSPALFGVLSTAMIFVFLMRGMVLNSISTGLVTLRAPTDRDYDTGFWLCVAIAGAACVIMNLAAWPLARLYQIDYFASVIHATSVIVLLFGLSYAHVGWARRNFRFKSLAMRNTISTAVAGVVGIGVALAGYGLTALVLNQVISAVLGLALLWRAIPWRPQRRFSVASARTILKTAVPLGLAQTLQFIAQDFDTALVTYLLGPFSGGLYAAGKRVVLAVQIALWQPMSSVALPAFAEVTGDPDRFARAAVRMSGLVMALTAPLFAGIAVTAPVATVVLFGPKWEAAAPVLTVLAAFGMFGPTLSLLQQMVVAQGHSRMVLAVTLVQMAVALCAVALFGRGNPIGVAISLSAPVLASVVVTLVILSRLADFPMGRYLVAIGRPLVCSAIMVIAVLAVPALDHGPLAQLAAEALVGGVVYMGAAFVLARDAVDELSGFAMALLKRAPRRERLA